MTRPATIVVLAKAPVAGRVKTRLTPPLSPAGAAALARAALLDTLDVVRGIASARVVLALDGDPGLLGADATDGVVVIGQEGTSLGERIVAAALAATPGGGPVALVGMDTPQLTASGVTGALDGLVTHDGVLGPACDGGWWLLALRRAGDAEAVREVPMSRPDTCRATRDALLARDLRVGGCAPLRDVDTAADAREVAAAAPGTRFAAAVELAFRRSA